MKSISLTVACFAVVACTGSAPTDPPVAATSAAVAQPEALEGTWAFDLDASDLAAPLRERCAAQTGGDRAKQEACFAEVRAEASREKIRFARAADGRVVWTSFGVQDGREEVFLELPVELTADGPHAVLARAAGAPRGAQAERFAERAPTAMRVEIVDSRTIAMVDPSKGRLVYARQ